ncbi:MAG: S8 family serine peptidase [Caldilineae bacterium]|nr:S8 family serine peptidase [Chloroflexota bacterium]MCB9176521.1 S8 family serine peptidase [Caldilineae bacterium]
MPRSSRRWLPTLLLAATLLGLGPASGGFGPAPEPALAALEAAVDAVPEPLALLADLARRPAFDKLDPSLQALATRRGADDAPIYLVLKSAQPVDLSAYAEWSSSFRWPAGEHISLLSARPSSLTKLAALPGVASVESGDPAILRELPQPVEPEMAYRYEALDGAAMRQRLAAAPSWQETAALLARQAASRGAASPDGATGPARPDGWFDVRQGHSAMEAWDMGFRGEGVRVAVMDTSIDFAHQDLQGAWAVLPEGSPYAGWPQVYDPYSAYLFGIDYATNRDDNPDNDTSFGSTAQSGLITLAQEAEVVAPAEAGAAPTACLSPLGTVRETDPNSGQPSNVRKLLEEDCQYKLPQGVSGSVRYGHHPDTYLAGQGANPAADPPRLNEYAGVLAVDADGDTVYDTVYVDLDLDHDFGNEKPVDQASPLSWRDLNGDAIADLSGGLLYFVADGQTPIPGGYLWGVGEAEAAPEAGTVVGFHYDTGGHGTLCASNVASQGRLGVPAGINLSYRDLGPGEGPFGGMNPGMAPDARVIAVGNIYAGPIVVLESAWRYAVLGADPETEGDEAQVVSNSYGFSSDNDAGWGSYSRNIDYHVRHFSPSTVFLVSAGNGGPGYGILVEPAPLTGMNIAASTQMGSTGWDSIFETGQITFGDIVPWSNAGPAMLGGTGVHVAADGAYAAGALPINSVTTNAGLPEERRNGEFANTTWGGTSRSSPIAAGNLALVYQAFKQKHGRWPSWLEARTIFMAGARYNGYDGYHTGAGTVDAADSVRIAAGMHGVTAMPPEWTAGDYHGSTYPGFASIAHPGDSHAASFSLANAGEAEVEVALSAGALRLISASDQDWTTADSKEESPYNFNAPDYLKKIEIDQIPEGTELMVVRANLPLGETDTDVSAEDPDGSQSIDNRWRLGVFQHTDWDDDTLLWDDKDGDGIVDIVENEDVQVGLDASTNAIVWEQSELDEGEYIRFSYLSALTDSFLTMVQHPRERYGSGIYVGLWHQEICNTNGQGEEVCQGRPESVPNTHFSLRYEFYRYEEWPWLSLGEDSVTVPAGGEASFEATLALPADAPYGSFQGAIYADYARAEGDTRLAAQGGWEPEGLRTVIPVNVNVAAASDGTAPITFGGEAAYDGGAMYNNAAVRGAMRWGWRPESGDWRFFFLDAEEPEPGTKLVLRSTWEDDLPGQSDIDSHIWQPNDDRFSNPAHADNADDDWSDPSWYGPHGMRLAVQSPTAGQPPRWAFDTTSGADEDWLVTDAAEGLNEVVLHNVLYSGKAFDVPFETTLGTIRVQPDVLELRGLQCGTVNFEPAIDLPGFDVQAFGLTEPEAFVDQEIGQDDQNDPTTSGFKHDIELSGPAARFEITLDGKSEAEGFDLDLFLLYDANGDGEFTYAPGTAANELVASSATPTGDEAIRLSGFTPAGKYQVWVHGWSVPVQPAPFDLTIDAVYGDAMKVSNLPDDVQPGGRYSFQVCPDAAQVEDMQGPANGVAVFGPSGAPTLLQIPVRWTAGGAIDATVLHLPMLSNGEAATP